MPGHDLSLLHSLLIAVALSSCLLAQPADKASKLPANRLEEPIAWELPIVCLGLPPGIPSSPLGGKREQAAQRHTVAGEVQQDSPNGDSCSIQFR